MVSAAFKNRTRDEVIAAFRESIRKKHEWEAHTQEVFERIREERRQLSLWSMNALDLAYINRLAPYKVWTENGRDYLIETKYDLLFRIGFMMTILFGRQEPISLLLITKEISHPQMMMI